METVVLVEQQKLLKEVSILFKSSTLFIVERIRKNNTCNQERLRRAYKRYFSITII
jgi:hypothetical protein